MRFSPVGSKINGFGVFAKKNERGSFFIVWKLSIYGRAVRNTRRKRATDVPLCPENIEEHLQIHI